MFLDYNLQYELLNEHRYRLATEAEQAKMRKSSTNQPLRIWRYVADLLPHVIGGEESEGERCRVVPAAGVVE